MEKLYELFAKTVAAVALIVAVLTMGSFILALPVKWAWNGTMPYLFDLKEITYWQAFGLFWLFGLLVKGSPKKADS